FRRPVERLSGSPIPTASHGLRQRRLPKPALETGPPRVDRAVLRQRLMGKDIAQLFHDLLFRMRASDRQFLYEQVAGGIEHLAFAERQLLIAFEDKQITQYRGNLQHRARLDLFRILTVAAVSRVLGGAYAPVGASTLSAAYQ